MEIYYVDKSQANVVHFIQVRNILNTLIMGHEYESPPSITMYICKLTGTQVSIFKFVLKSLRTI
jgi:hypothetical protein